MTGSVGHLGIKFLYLVAFIFIPGMTQAQTKSDTISIDANRINTSFLQPSTNRYLVYFKMGKDSARKNVAFWTRNIEHSTYKGRDAIQIAQSWEDKEGLLHTVTSTCDKKTFAPLHQQSWWRQSGKSEFDFINKTASLKGLSLTDADTARNRRGAWNAFKVACNQYVLNWHLDLEVFSLLPFKEGKTFLIPFYDPGSPPPSSEAYTVVGSANLEGYDHQKIECWLLSHSSKGNKELFWISKKTKEVLKLEQEIAMKTGTMYRYKIKLGFSI
jgi:hypothetical protein